MRAISFAAGHRRSAFGVERWATSIALAVYGGLDAPFVLAALVVIGLPATWILAKLRTEGLLQYALAGVIGGLLFWPIVIVPCRGSTASQLGFHQRRSPQLGC
ncbi:hypothetical protein [uncultured Phenylobacterium sp.]|uniref:hypothetical protein n=1 Tax=uncultured Phenylobacterium sp. TaxID=349273 RepID=UPI0025CCBFF6|nr:hypothetical protein [uncultured Phenylobacterium sp.]